MSPVDADIWTLGHGAVWGGYESHQVELCQRIHVSVGGL